MNALEIKINVEIEILKNEEKKIRNITDCFKKQTWIIRSLYKNSEYEYKKYRSVKRLEKEVEKWQVIYE